MFKRLKYLLSLGLLFMLLTSTVSIQAEDAEDRYVFTSPDARIQGELYLEDGAINYTVTLNEKPVIYPSHLGLAIEEFEGANDATSVELLDSGYTEETYATRGNASEVTDSHNYYSYEIDFGSYTLGLELKLWNNGLAYRYILPNEGVLNIDEERSTYTFPADTMVWYQMDNQAMQELYQGKAVEDFTGREIVTASSTFELPDDLGYISLSEGNLSNFAGIAYKSLEDNTFKAHYWSSINGFETTATESPWRIMLISDTLNGLVNNTIAQNVSEPPSEELEQAEWIVPGKAVWFEGYDDNGNIIEKEARASLEASKLLDIKYHVVGNNWREWGGTMEEAMKKVVPFVELAAEYDIGIVIGHDVPNLAMYPDGNLYDPEIRLQFLNLSKEAGVAGIKFGHIETETVEAVNIYETLLLETADLHLMALFHNSNKPTGLARTYPNLLTQEGIRGMQYNLDAKNNTIIPFTRLLAGGADYTPINFTDDLRLGNGTWPHMLANAVIMQSSLLTFIDSPVAINNNDAAEFIKLLPTTWDETIILPQSDIGSMAVYARRTGDDWVIAAQNAPDEIKEIEIPLDFLTGETEYSSLEYHDAMENKKSYTILENYYTKNDTISFTVNQGGGFVAYLKITE